jgi:amidase
MPTLNRASDLYAHTAAELARLIRQGTCTSVEVVEAHLDRINTVNPAINAVVTLDEAAAREAARSADAARAAGHPMGLLHGVPITVKDGFATKGIRTTFGLRWYGRRLDTYTPPEDAPTVAALRRAGAIILGKTNLPFGSYDWQSDHPLFGRTNNPHDVRRTPGGSSGGSAAAVAAGCSPLDLASDVAGSIRVPSHFCGVLSMRPTEGSVPLQGMAPPAHPATLNHAIVGGPIARSVSDLRLAHAILTERHDASSGVARSDTGENVSLPELHVAFSTSVGGAPVAEDIDQGIRTFANSLRQAGCTVKEQAPPVDFNDAQKQWGRVHGFEFASGLPLGLGRSPINKVFRLGLMQKMFGRSAYSVALEQGYSATRRTYLAALTQRNHLVRRIQQFLSSWDIWVCPVAGVTAFPHCETGAPVDVDGETVPYAEPIGAYNTGTALAGTPCIVLPVGTDSHGLPIAVQIHARRRDDARLLNIVEAIERDITGPINPVTPPDAHSAPSFASV